MCTVHSPSQGGDDEHLRAWRVSSPLEYTWLGLNYGSRIGSDQMSIHLIDTM